MHIMQKTDAMQARGGGIQPRPSRPVAAASNSNLDLQGGVFADLFE